MKVNELLLHPSTASSIQRLLKHPGHAWLIIGDKGSGAIILARKIAADLLKIKPVSLINAPYFREIVPEKSSVSIDQIRELRSFLSLRTTGQSTVRRIVLINSAGTMQHEAQNALLKLLEEPPLDTVILLTAEPNDKLLSTIRSRVRTLQLLTPTLDAALDYYDYPKQEVRTAYMISDGQQELMLALLAEDKSHPLVLAIDRSKSLLGTPVFERLQHIDELAKDKAGLQLLLLGAVRVCKAGMVAAADKNQDNQTKRWLERVRLLQETQLALSTSPNGKLLLTNLMLNL